jgi:hypothetical protein
MSLCAAVFSVASCTHTTDRVIEPAGADDASSTVPEATDASLSPIGPVAHSRPATREPPPDFSLVRSPELGLALPARHELGLRAEEQAVPATGGSAGVGGAAGYSGSDRRPVSSGGGRYF